MSNNNNSTDARDDREIVITRVFNAPRELVWNVWTEPKHMEQWWGPKGFTTRVIELDLRPGGQWRFVMIGPDGTEYPIKGIFREVIPPKGLSLPMNLTKALRRLSTLTCHRES